MSFSKRNTPPSGYTLLEVILAIALSVVVMMLIGVAIDGHYQLVSGGRGKVEEAQLARAILRQIADDLRSTVRYETLDMSSVVTLIPGGEDLSDDLDNIDDELGDGPGGELGDGPGGELGGDLGGALGGALGEGEGEEETQAAGDEPEPVEDIAQGYVPPKVPGLYGNATEILIDVSRLPRVDEYEQMLLSEASGLVQDIPSDVKSVAYYVSARSAGLRSGNSASSSPAGATEARGGQEPTGGLVRRSLDRAVTAWAAENGNTDDLEKSAQVLAPEVTAIRFRYFNGSKWFDEWNSDAYGGIPLAVQISLTLLSAPRRSATSRAITSFSGGDDDRVESRYLQIVHLPGAEPTETNGSQAANDTANEDSGAETGASP